MFGVRPSMREQRKEENKRNHLIFEARLSYRGWRSSGRACERESWEREGEGGESSGKALYLEGVGQEASGSP